MWEGGLVEPVKLTIWISGCLESVAPAVGPSPCTMLNTPGGKPAEWTISAKRIAERGVNSEGCGPRYHWIGAGTCKVRGGKGFVYLEHAGAACSEGWYDLEHHLIYRPVPRRYEPNHANWLPE